MKKTTEELNNEVINLGFRVDTMAFLHEIADGALSIGHMGVLKIPLNVFKNLLARVAQRSVEINDPKLNILMMSLNLYEIPPTEIVNEIKKQMLLIEK